MTSDNDAGAPRRTADDDRPFFTPLPEMRRAYLAARQAELDILLSLARENVWKEVVTVAQHVRGSGAMYGFDGVGLAAENLSRAIQNGDQKCMDYMHAYAGAVNAAYI